jgi:hypothetical protein
MLEVKEALEEAEGEEEEVLVESVDEDATLALDVEALEGLLEEDELITELEVLGAAAVVGVVVGAAEVDTGAALEG